MRASESPPRAGYDRYASFERESTQLTPPWPSRPLEGIFNSQSIGPWRQVDLLVVPAWIVCFAHEHRHRLIVATAGCGA